MALPLRTSLLAVLLTLSSRPADAQRPLKVYISADLEGIAGLSPATS
jgi:hypothetical protein